MSYDELYKNNPQAWGSELSELWRMAIELLPSSASLLDAGTAQGRDAIALARLGFEVTALDSSPVGIEKLRSDLKTLQGLKVEPVCCDLIEYEHDEMFDAVGLLNVVQTMPRPASLGVLEAGKRSVKPGGLIVISAFTTEEPGYRPDKESRRTFFAPNELSGSFKDWDVIHYYEGMAKDPGHAGYETPHEHGVANMIARKPQ